MTILFKSYHKSTMKKNLESTVPSTYLHDFGGGTTYDWKPVNQLTVETSSEHRDEEGHFQFYPAFILSTEGQNKIAYSFFVRFVYK